MSITWRTVLFWAAAALVLVHVALEAVSLAAPVTRGAQGGAPAALGGGGAAAAAALQPRHQKRSPAHTVVLAYPKTASGSIINAIAWYLSPSGRLAIPRFHFPDAEFATAFRAMNCSEENWCLIVSTARKPGPQLISWFFQSYCGNGQTSAPRCQEILNSTDDQLESMVFAFARPNIGSLTHWWSQARHRLMEGGLHFEVADLARDGRAVLPAAVWLALRFEEVESHQAILGRWFPGIRFPEETGPSRRVYRSKYEHISARLRDESRWPPDLRAAMLATETMQLFYTSGQ